jgi:hypothetical protein
MPSKNSEFREGKRKDANMKGVGGGGGEVRGGAGVR